MFPRYSYPPLLVLRVFRDALFLRLRNLQADARACILQLRPPLKVAGTKNLPASGCFVVTVNHYHRSGFGAQWLALAVAANVPQAMHWVMTAEWTAPDRWYEPLKSLYSRFILSRLAHIYGFTPMPPMPPREKDVEARARAIRSVLDKAKLEPEFILGFVPEGFDSIDGSLSVPPAGVGRFLLLLANRGFRFVPVGAYEMNGELCLHFGPAYHLSVPSGLASQEKDQIAAKIVMLKIAELLPESLRGVYA